MEIISSFWFKIFLFLLLFALVSAAIMVLLFGVGSGKDWQEKKGKLVILLLVGFSLLAAGSQVFTPKNWLSQAVNETEIMSLKIKPLIKGQYLVTFKTNNQVFASLECQDSESQKMFSVFPFSNEETKEHSFLVSDIGSKGGVVWVIINGKRLEPTDEPIVLEK
ncbi:MAG: hypothetical protein ABIB61_04310 [Candidatus Shapirobacteria bacterium]